MVRGMFNGFSREPLIPASRAIRNPDMRGTTVRCATSIAGGSLKDCAGSVRGTFVI